MPIATLTQVDRSADYPVKDLPKLEVKLLITPELLEDMIKEVRATGRSNWTWEIRMPHIAFSLETVDRTKASVMDTNYTRGVIDSNKRILHITTL